MRLLLDECVDPELATLFRHFDVVHVDDRGWKGKTNGELLTLAQDEFDVLVTIDKGLPYQQNLAKYNLIVALIRSMDSKIEALAPLVPLLEERLRQHDGAKWFTVP